MPTIARARASRLVLAVAATLPLTLTLPMTDASAVSAGATQRLQNPSFEQPGSNGAIPTNWQPVLFDNETSPFRTAFETYNSSGQFPPPASVVDQTFAVEVFYQVGSFQGVGGFGGQQPASAFVGGNSGLTEANDPELVYNTVQTFFANPTRANWAGGIAEVEFTRSSGGTFKLRYYHKYSATYRSAPVDGTTVKYSIETPYSGNGTAQRDVTQNVEADILTEFGFADFQITAVRFGNLLDQVAGSGSFPNSTTYWDNIRLFTADQQVPAPVIPEVPLTMVLPLAGAGVFAAFAVRRARRAAVLA